MATWSKEVFERLYNLDISQYVEPDYKKFNYLSWANAYMLLLKEDPNASYEVLKAPDFMPFFSRGGVNFVFTRVTAFGITKEMYLPIMDNTHKSVAEPNSMHVNNAIQRCLAKNIASFGIGLKLYTGEDIEQYKEPTEKPQQHNQPKYPPKTPPKPQNKPETQEEKVKQNHIAVLCKVNALKGFTDEQLKASLIKKFGISSKKDLTVSQFKEVIGLLQRCPDRKTEQELAATANQVDQMDLDGTPFMQEGGN